MGGNRVMNRFYCINLVNDLEEFNLITRKQRDSIIRKRDKQAKKAISKGKRGDAMKGCQHRDHLKMKLIEAIINYKHETDDHHAWLYDLDGELRSIMNKSR